MSTHAHPYTQKIPRLVDVKVMRTCMRMPACQQHVRQHAAQHASDNGSSATTDTSAAPTAIKSSRLFFHQARRLL